jgi:hypothetical protein
MTGSIVMFDVRTTVDVYAGITLTLSGKTCAVMVIYIVLVGSSWVWFELLCLIGLRVESLLSRWRRLISANLVNSYRIVGYLDLAQELLIVEGAGFF